MSRPIRSPDNSIMLRARSDDRHGLPHLEHEDLAAVAHRRSLQHQLHRLRDGHEVAFHVGMGDRHRPARCDLVAGRSVPRCRALPSTLPKRTATTEWSPVSRWLRLLHDQLCYALAGAHHVGRVHRLVLPGPVRRAVMW